MKSRGARGCANSTVQTASRFLDLEGRGWACKSKIVSFLSVKPPRCCRWGLNYLLEKEEKNKKRKKKKKERTKPTVQRPSLRERDGDAKAPLGAARRPSAFRGHREFGAAPGLDAEPGPRPSPALCGRPRHRGGRRDFPERPGGEALTRGCGSAGGGSRRPARCEPAGPEGAARMAAGGGRNAPVCGGERGSRAPQHDGMWKDGGGEQYWSR